MVAHRQTLSHTLNTHRQTHKKSPYVINVKLIEQLNLIVLNYTSNWHFFKVVLSMSSQKSLIYLGFF